MMSEYAYAAKEVGRFYTTNSLVKTVMKNLIQNHSGAALEPSAGRGDFVCLLEQFSYSFLTALDIEPDSNPVCQTKIQKQDFFLFSQQTENKYQTILANPPYVVWKNLPSEVRQKAERVQKAYSQKVNSVVLFLDCCLQLLAEKGEMIMIIPKEWFFATAAAPLRKKFREQGSFSHLIDCGETKIFPDAVVPSLMIFRWVKNKVNPNQLCLYAPDLLRAEKNQFEKRTFLLTQAGHFGIFESTLATEIQTWSFLGNFYEAKVGLATGRDSVFRVSPALKLEANAFSAIMDTSRQRSLLIDVNQIENFQEIPPQTAAYLLTQKQKLLERKIASFNDSNWWKYGAIRNQKIMKSNRQRFYVLERSRQKEPFFLGNPGELFAGTLLGLFEKENTPHQIEQTVALLNSSFYHQIFTGLMLLSGNRLVLHQAVLEDLPFPWKITPHTFK